MEMKTGHFSINISQGVAHVERFFTFGPDEITLKMAIKGKDDADLTIKQLHRASLQAAIQHLQALLAKSDPK